MVKMIACLLPILSIIGEFDFLVRIKYCVCWIMLWTTYKHLCSLALGTIQTSSGNTNPNNKSVWIHCILKFIDTTDRKGMCYFGNTLSFSYQFFCGWPAHFAFILASISLTSWFRMRTIGSVTTSNVTTMEHKDSKTYDPAEVPLPVAWEMLEMRTDSRVLGSTTTRTDKNSRKKVIVAFLWELLSETVVAVFLAFLALQKSAMYRMTGSTVIGKTMREKYTAMEVEQLSLHLEDKPQIQDSVLKR